MKALELYFKNLQKMAIFQKSKYLLQKLVIEQKMCKNKIAQIATNYTFLKSPWPNEYKCAKHLQNFKT